MWGGLLWGLLDRRSLEQADWVRLAPRARIASIPCTGSKNSLGYSRNPAVA
jgi:hypothetical protein